jgi:large subunit ribosomal protein L47
MRAIRHTLTERYYLWEDARKLAETDPEIDLSGKGTPYTPAEYLEDELPEELVAEAVAEAELEEESLREERDAIEHKSEDGKAQSVKSATANPATLPTSKPHGEEAPRL